MVNDQDVPQDTSEATMSPAQDQFAQPTRIKKDYAGYLVLIAGIGAFVWGLVSAVGTGWGFWEYTSGLKGVFFAFLLGIGAILIGLFQTWRARKSVAPPLRTRRASGESRNESIR